MDCGIDTPSYIPVKTWCTQLAKVTMEKIGFLHMLTGLFLLSTYYFSALWKNDNCDILLYEDLYFLVCK